MVASHGKDKVILQLEWTVRGLEIHVFNSDFRNRTAEVGSNLAILDAVFNVRQNPVLDVIVQLGSTMHQGHARPVPPEVERRDGSRVFAANDNDIHVEKGMRLAVVVENLGKVFAGDIQRIG